MPKLPGRRWLSASLLLVSVLISSSAGAEYTLQTGSHREAGKAESEVRAWQERGYAAHREREERGDAWWHSVRVGTFDSEAEARRAGVFFIQEGWLTRFSIRAIGTGPTVDAPHQCWSLHLSSYRSETAAARDLAAWKEAGRDGFQRLEQVSGAPWHRVYLGPYASEGEARAAGRELRRSGNAEYFRVAAVCPKPAISPPEAPPLPPPAAVAPPAEPELEIKIEPDSPTQIQPERTAEADGSHSVDPMATPVAETVDPVAVAEEIRSETRTVPPTRKLEPVRAEPTVVPEPPAEPDIDGPADALVLQPSPIAPPPEAAPVLFPEMPMDPPEKAEDSAAVSLTAPLHGPAVDIAAREPTGEPVESGTAPAQRRPEGPTVAEALGARAAIEPESDPSPPVPGQKPEKRADPPAERFRFSLQGGLFVVTGADSFRVEWLDGNVLRDADMGNGSAPVLGVDAAARLAGPVGLYAGGSWSRGEMVSLRTLAGGVEYTVTRRWPIVPYLRAGLLYARFDWTEPPGSFDPTRGWELGAGAHFPWRSVRIGGLVSYRSLEFSYDGGNIPSLTATSDTLNLSGFYSVATLSIGY